MYKYSKLLEKLNPPEPSLITPDKDYSPLRDVLNKAIVSNPLAEIDINTSEQSQDELAAQTSTVWVDAIEMAVKDSQFGDTPNSINLTDHRVLYLSKVDDGIYSGIVRNEDSTSGSSGQTLVQLSKMTPEAMVQALKAKGYIPKDDTEASQAQEAAPSDAKYAKLKELLDGYSPNEVHIHLGD